MSSTMRLIRPACCFCNEIRRARDANGNDDSSMSDAIEPYAYRVPSLAPIDNKRPPVSTSSLAAGRHNRENQLDR
jgi:hypothetical protein